MDDHPRAVEQQQPLVERLEAAGQRAADVGVCDRSGAVNVSSTLSLASLLARTAHGHARPRPGTSVSSSENVPRGSPAQPGEGPPERAALAGARDVGQERLAAEVRRGEALGEAGVGGQDQACGRQHGRRHGQGRDDLAVGAERAIGAETDRRFGVAEARQRGGFGALDHE
ncbi:hypothetical protein OV079_11270 [Nannocystis pusilla]|uniref:Uncharacterized protein n=1 Tax=Nannocystis pusilla TaxID=889268 RepID=A0A9X3IW67_9BACT|nr:hypothetical protein [Nannocystis pusilla]MCY1006131.1 hypothetical protein [Nannocystis pusilla]